MFHSLVECETREVFLDRKLVIFICLIISKIRKTFPAQKPIREIEKS